MTGASAASLTARIDLSSQTMTVSQNGVVRYTWKVSSGRKGYGTPTGSWSAKWLSRNHRSRKYNNAPMPHSVFFHGGYAIHGTYEVKRLGRPASHGCIRLAPQNAAAFFAMVQRTGNKNTRIVITR
jgi:lipoprotein-anchoring transpeptidase ErfK/SrfK